METLSDGPKILTLDIETSPNLALVFDLFQQNISLGQLLETTRVICVAYKWHHEAEVGFLAEWIDEPRMLDRLHELLDEADVVVTYNGKRFDIPHIQRELALASYAPPSPFAQVDLYEVCKRKFRFPSHKLAHVAKEFGLSGKIETGGIGLWVGVEARDPASLAQMEAYNRQDVVTTEELYDRVLPWIDSHPHHGLYVDVARPVCNRCGSTRMQKRGSSYTRVSAFQRFQCQSCGGWSRGGRRVNAVDVRGTAT